MNRRSFHRVLGAAAASTALRAAKQYEAHWDSIRTHTAPAWAPPTGELGKIEWTKWFRENSCAEWNYDFAGVFDKEAQNWKPAVWAKLFGETGARYVVLTSKHHDGFRLWPSRVENPQRASTAITAQRDLVGDLSAAVRGEGLKMGLYYSGGLDWTFQPRPITTRGDVVGMALQTEEYARYADVE